MRAPLGAILVTLSLMLAVEGSATADILDPLAYASQGAFPTAPGQYTFNDFSITGPGGLFIPAKGPAGIWDFDSITMTASMSFRGTGTVPVVLLSRGDVTMQSTSPLFQDAGLSVSAYGSGQFLSSEKGGPGGGAGGDNAPVVGHLAGGPGGGLAGGGQTIGGGGGGYGGAGGNGANAIFNPPPFFSVGLGGPANGPAGGGSGGGAGGFTIAKGGGGGGAIEIAALGQISVVGSIAANGGAADEGGGGAAGGGGSGGLIYLQAPSVLLSGALSANGGNSRHSPGGKLGGGGGGSYVEIVTAPGGFQALDFNISVAGGTGANNGSPGQVIFQQILPPISTPEPASMLLLAVGLIGLPVALARRARAQSGRVPS
jgi:PEP-CTERM motif